MQMKPIMKIMIDKYLTLGIIDYIRVYRVERSKVKVNRLVINSVEDDL